MLTPGRGCALNEGRSLNPGDTRGVRADAPIRRGAQRRPESEPRRHPPPTRSPGNRPPALNEGRSLNPGDTVGSEGVSRGTADAQRRPESEPRRHAAMSACSAESTSSAQRRPESEPRRHRPASTSTPAPPAALNEGRSLNPGDTRRRRHPRRRRRPLNEGRSLNPGDTRRGEAGRGIGSRCAQRRPESEPRRHEDVDSLGPVLPDRSTKAGV